MSRWFRFYTSVVDDPKAQMLAPELFKHWINVLCIAAQNDGELPPLAATAFTLRLPETKAAGILAKLCSLNLLDKTEKSFKPHNWDGRQYKSDRDDTAAERSKKYRDAKRERHASVTRDATETSRPPETETETESSLRSDSAPAPSPAKAKRVKARSVLPDDWKLADQDVAYAVSRGFDYAAIDRMGRAFSNHHHSKGSLMADWHAAWRTWCENEIRFSANRQGNCNGKRTVHDAANDLVARVRALDEPAPSGLCERAGEGSVRLLPSGRC